jgi:hypothetical protein
MRRYRQETVADTTEDGVFWEETEADVGTRKGGSSERGFLTLVGKKRFRESSWE